MKKINLYLILLVFSFFMIGCVHFKTKVPPKEEITPAPTLPLTSTPTVEIVEEEEEQKPQKKSSFIEANFIKEDKYTKVFKNCFSTGQVELNKSCKKELRAFLKETPLSKKREVLIEVHTDMGGSAKKNLSISKKRAYSAAASLYYKDYKHSTIYYNGFGESQPLYNERSKKADSENRRLVVFLKDKNAKVDKKKYKKFAYKVKKKKKKSQTKTQTKIKTKHVASKKRVTPSADLAFRANLVKYTGKADTGWMYFGKKELKEKFLISCADDKPIKMRQKAIAKSKKREFTTGLYNKRISGNYGKNYVEIYPIYVYENGYLPKSNPIVTVYGKDRKVTRYQTTINTYRGKKGILYRIFVNGKKEMKCMDLVLPYRSDIFSHGVVYAKDAKGMLKEFKFTPED